MEIHHYISMFLLPLILFFLLSLIFSKKPKSKIPPGPKPWPIIGNIHLLGQKPHQSLTKLSKIYGPLMSLKLGNTFTIVISSPNIAKEMFIKHDLAFSSRKIPHSVTALDHDKYSIVYLPVSPKWRHLRKIVKTELFSSLRLDATMGLRQKKVDELVEYVRDCSESGLAIDVGKAAFATSLNLLSDTLLSVDLYGHDSWHMQEFKELVIDILVQVARPNLSDFFPLLKHLDLQGVKRRVTGYLAKMLEFVQGFIDQRMLNNSLGAKDDVLGTLLKLVDENELSLDDVKHLLVDLFIAGTDTSTSTVDWAMTELLRHPKKMVKAQAEIDQIIGKDGVVQEMDISKLPYFQAVVKETLRLHPPVPFLIPHKAEKDVQLCNYHVPKNTQVLVNVWSFGRDPSIWPNPESFVPERFLEKGIDMKDQDFELIPFGAGRRICPGLLLGYRMVHLMLATLLHSFDWKLPNGMNPEDVDVEEKFGLALHKVCPTQAVPLSR